MKSHYRDGEYGRAVECYDADEVDAQIATLTARIADLEARDIHTCHDQCERPLCVANRRVAELEKDAARYRGIRDGSVSVYDILEHVGDGYNGPVPYQGDELDAHV